MIRVAVLLLLSSATVLAQGTDRRRGGSPSPAPGQAAPAASSSPLAPTQDYAAFQLILERNIFNPTRVGRTRVANEEKPPRAEEISLVGVIRYDTRAFAVFHSPEAAFRREVPEGGEIADFRVTKVTAAGVELLKGDKAVSLAVAQQIRRAEGGEWTVSAPKAPAADPRAAARSTETAPVEIPANASEVLKRLMKQREQQLKK
jgi:hypothetical protein